MRSSPVVLGAPDARQQLPTLDAQAGAGFDQALDRALLAPGLALLPTAEQRAA